MRIGILGAGQLGRMMALAGYPLGLQFTFFDRTRDTPGAQLAEIITGEFDDSTLLRKLAGQCDCLTFDWENVPVEPLRKLGCDTPVQPPLLALETGQDRLSEKQLFGQLGIPTAAYAAVDSLEDLGQAAGKLGFPCLLKTRRLGYDGKGQYLLRGEGDLVPAWESLGGTPLILEQFVHFDYEVSQIAARSTRGEAAYYPLARNVHKDGILHYSIAPWADPELAARAREYLERLMTHFSYAGILTVEFFVCGRKLIANEMAPRVHNSGHWTIEGAHTSQFENHLRAIVGLPLGDPSARGHSAMVNLLGAMPALPSLLELQGAHVHDYGKSPRPLRKIGHCTLVRENAEDRDDGLKQLLSVSTPDID
jgi:5-(carboxyamino)imidazole ribonucleotide synthase